MSRFLFRLGRWCARHPWRSARRLARDRRRGARRRHPARWQHQGQLHRPRRRVPAGDDVLNANFPQFSGLSGQLVFHVDDGSITEPDRVAAIEAAVAGVRGVADVTAASDPFDPAGPTVSADGMTAFATVYFDRDTIEEPAHRGDRGSRCRSPATPACRPSSPADSSPAGDRGQRGDRSRVAVVVLLIAFGSVIAMGLPIVTALLGLGSGSAVSASWPLRRHARRPSPMLASMIGLGVGIDYALFVVTRHRQHLAEGMTGRGRRRRGERHRGQSRPLRRDDRRDRHHSACVMAGIPAITTMGFAVGHRRAVLDARSRSPCCRRCLGLAGRQHRPAGRSRIASTRSPTAHQHRSRAGGPTTSADGRGATRSPACVGAVAIAAAGARHAHRLRRRRATPPTRRHAAHRYDLLAEGFGPGFNGPFTLVVDLGERRRSRRRSTRSPTRSPPTAGVAAVQPPVAQRRRRHGVVIVPPTTSPQDARDDRHVTALRDDVLPAAVPAPAPAPCRRPHGDAATTCPTGISDRLPLFIVAVVGAVVRAADGGVPLGPRAPQGGDHEPAVDRRGLRRDRRRVPVGLGQGSRRPRRHRAGQPVRADDHVRDPVRALDGLRGVPAVPGPRGVPAHRRQPPERGRRPRGDGPGHHLGRADHDQRVRCLRRRPTT